MEKQEIEELAKLRAELIKEFERLRDYKNNPNAIMKEIDCARIIHNAVSGIDKMLEGKVEFRQNKK